MRLIDVDHFIKSLSDFDFPTDTINACELRILLYTEPKVDAVTKKEGKWSIEEVKHPMTDDILTRLVCSECGYIDYRFKGFGDLPNFCCECGSRNEVENNG